MSLQVREPHSNKHQKRAPVHSREAGERFPPSTLGTEGVDGYFSSAVWVTSARFSVVSRVLMCSTTGNKTKVFKGSDDRDV